MNALYKWAKKVHTRVGRALDGPASAYSEQFLYGMREVMVLAADLTDEVMFRATFQHGWDIQSHRGQMLLSGRRSIHFAWSNSAISRTQQSIPNVIPIGAPFLYLVELASTQKPTTKSKRPVLFFPAHSTEVLETNAYAQVDLIRARYNPKDVVVCLYWADFIDPRARRAYESFGFEVTSVGYSGLMAQGADSHRNSGTLLGGRALFLLNLYRLLTSHDVVVSSEFGSACLYAAHLRIPVQILTDWYETPLLSILGTTDRARPKDDPREASVIALLEQEFSCSFSDLDFGSIAFANFADRELGVPHKLSLEALQMTLQPLVLARGNKVAVSQLRAALSP